LEEVEAASILHIVGTFAGVYVVDCPHLDGLRSMAPADLMSILSFTHQRNLASVHLSLVDSYELLECNRTAEAFIVEHHSRPAPTSVTEALSPRYVAEFGPAMDRENERFLKHECFEPAALPAGARLLPGHWLFSYKRDGQPKARFVLGGHRQRLGMDYFEHKNYCAVLSSRDNRILLALAAAEHWAVYQTDIVQAFLHGVLDDVDIYIKPPDRYPCPAEKVLKLRKAVYGLHQAPVKFKQEVVDWFRAHGYQPANDAETIWILREPAPQLSAQLLFSYMLSMPTTFFILHRTLASTNPFSVNSRNVLT
jgi:hypothetical protein